MKEEKTKKEVIYFRESALQSIIADIGMFGSLVGAFWINYQFIGSSKIVATVILVMWFISIVSRANAKKLTFTSKEDLLKHINETM